MDGPARPTFQTPESIGADILEIAGETAAEDTPQAPAAPEPAPAQAPAVDTPADDQDADTEPGAVEQLAEPDYFQVADDGSVTVNGRTYASSEEAFKALYHAQRHIDTTRAPQPPAPDEEWELEEEDGDEAEQARPLLASGAPIGGEPETLQELAEWAIAQPAQAAQWALANQHRIDSQSVSEIYAHWVANDAAGAHNYLVQMQASAVQQAVNAAKEELRAELAPFQRDRQVQNVQQVLDRVRQLPYAEHYEPRMRAEIESFGPDYIAELDKLSPDDQYDELFTVYSRLRVADALAGQTPSNETPAAAAAQPAPDGRPAGAPVTEKRGARAPQQTPADDLGDFVTDAVAAFQDPFSLR